MQKSWVSYGRLGLIWLVSRIEENGIAIIKLVVDKGGINSGGSF